METFHGCDDDCFNCIYSDCRKPANKMRSTKTMERTPKEDEGNCDESWDAAIDYALEELRV